jgi:anaerobic nitric oxide reductase transcription regulator
MDMIDTLVAIAVDLTTAMRAKDRYERLLRALGKVLPYEAAALLRVEGDMLYPMAARGLSADALGRRYALSDHPRLEIICSAQQPVRFPPDTPLPDPFDGLLANDVGALSRIHACLGCPLRVNDELIGVLTADALDPGAFDHMDPRFLEAVGALGGAQMQIARLIDALELSAERQGLIASELMQDIRQRQGNQLLGASAVMVHLRREIDLVARSDFSVLVLGETGVGKELVVRAIHAASRRKDAALLYLNCAALPETLAESELFGHTKGAFTGANQDRAGKFELAHQGTLFLDEVGELAPSIQAKLLRALQEGEVQRVGSDRATHVDVRLLAATNRDLGRAVEKGKFRSDLFHRLNVYPIKVPPLRDRREDIALLTGHFCERIQHRMGLGPVRLTPEAYVRMARYAWPGNVRELENVISRAVLKASAEAAPGSPVVIAPGHLGQDFMADKNSGVPTAPATPESNLKGLTLKEAVEDHKRHLIRLALKRNAGNWAAAARDLGLHRSNLHHLARRLGIKA